MPSSTDKQDRNRGDLVVDAGRRVSFGPGSRTLVSPIGVPEVDPVPIVRWTQLVNVGCRWDAVPCNAPAVADDIARASSQWGSSSDADNTSIPGDTASE